MDEVAEMTAQEAKERFDSKSAIFLDIRDSHSYQDSHIAGAINLNDDNVEDYLEKLNKNQTTIIYCYHGNSSIGATSFFQSQGFEHVYSLAGGYQAWTEL